MSKHTPHDWRTRTSQYEPEAFDIVQPGIGAIALVKNEQFALLMAAAPYLLAALNTWLEQYSAEEYEDCPEVVQTRAAIAKATGGAA